MLTLGEAAVLNEIRLRQPISNRELRRLIAASPAQRFDCGGVDLVEVIGDLAKAGLIHCKDGAVVDTGTAMLQCSRAGEAALRDWVLGLEPLELVPADPVRARVQALDLLSFEERLDWIVETKNALTLMLMELTADADETAFCWSDLADTQTLGAMTTRIDWLNMITYELMSARSRFRPAARK